MADTFYVYVLRSESNCRRYVGSCQDIVDRLYRYNSGQSKSTKSGLPWRLVHQEVFTSRSEAVTREFYFKTGKGREELDRLEKEIPQPV